MELSAGNGGSRHLTGVAITSDYFSVLGRAPLVGRTFTDADLQKNVRNVVLSARLWREHFHADPSIVGQTVRLDREPWTIIGVAPDAFEHVGGDYRSPMQGDTVDVWLPLYVVVDEMALRQYHFCNAVARVRAGVTLAQARQELEALARSYEARYPNGGPFGLRMEPLLNEVTGRSRDVIWLLAAAGALVLLIACANIAGLSVARAVARRQELGLRRALGASRWQLARVGLTENVIVGLAGAAVGLAIAAAGLPVLRHLLPADFPRAHEVGLTFAGAAFAVASALVTVVSAGLLASGSREALQPSLRVTAGRDSRRLRTALVVGEVALAGLLCAGTLFLLRSYEQIDARDHGFRPGGALTFQLTAPAGANVEPGQVARLFEHIRSSIAASPGVTAVGATTNLPWSGYDENTGFTIVGRVVGDGSLVPSTRYQGATAGYFEAAGMRLMQGRLFDAARDVKGQALVVIVNDALANRYFPGGDAVGSTIQVFGDSRRIAGIVQGITDNPTDLDTRPALWFPLGQVEFSTVFFAVRSGNLDSAALTPAVREAVRAVDPQLPLADIRTLEARASGALAARRFALWLFQVFAAIALILAAAGIYGLLAYVVRQRRKELGIRVALGASRASLSRMILTDGLRMAAIGAACALVLIPLGGSLLQSFLFNVQASDPVTIAFTPIALIAVAVLASLGPAISATRSDPAAALREE